MQYEYATINTTCFTEEEVLNKLNKYGKDGWKAIAPLEIMSRNVILLCREIEYANQATR